MQKFTGLTRRDLLAPAISSKEDGCIHADFAHGLQGGYPDSARMFARMAAEEDEQRWRLTGVVAERVGPHTSLARQAAMKDWVRCKPGLAGVHACAGVNGGICHAQFLERLPGPHGGAGR